MKKLESILFFVFLVCCINVAVGWDEPSFNKEDMLENLLEAPSMEESEDFKTLGYLNDDILIEMKVDMVNHKKNILTEVAKIIEKYIPNNPPEEQQAEIKKMAKEVQRCSDVGDNIWLIIKIRRLHDQRIKDGMIAEKPHKLQ